MIRVKLNSPWNIAVNFDLDMNFNIDEIKTIINEYAEENNLNMDNIKLAERLYFYTNGYPFLVSRLCQIIDEKIGLISKRPWNIEDIDMAVKEILKEGNTLFDDIVKNIENNEEIYKFIQGIILSGNEIPYIQSNLIISLCTVYGIIKDEQGICKVNNRIFELFLYNYMNIE